MTKCTSVVMLEHLDEETDVLKVTIDNETEAIMFFSYGEALKYVNQDVIVTYRRDMYRGQVTQFINTITIPVLINTLDRDSNIKLYVEQEDNFSNVSFADILEGETKLNAVVYCVSHSYESSAKSAWALLRVRDRSMRVADLRLFDYEYGKQDFSGQYIRADIRRSKYGLQSQIITPLAGESPVNPEITIARSFILETFSDCEDILTFLTKTRMLDLMADYIDIEKGYGLVRLAMELAMARELTNVSNAVNPILIRKALLLSKAFILTPASDYSTTFRNMVTVTNHQFEDKKDIMLLLDCEPSAILPEAEVLKNISALVDTLIKSKKEVS